MKPALLKAIVYLFILLAGSTIAIQLYWLKSTHFFTTNTSLHPVDGWITVSLILILASMALILVFLLIHRQRRLDEVQNNFVNNLLHEFRTPVSVLRLASNVLQLKGIEDQPERMKKYSQIIKDQSDQLEHKVNRILESTLSENKEINLEKESLDVREVIHQAINFVQPLVEEKKAIIEYKHRGDGVKIVGDSSYIRQCLINLLDNGIRYSERPKISIETERDEKNCIISIKDNGIGIDQKHQRYIFDRFYRVPTGNVHNVKGFGLGLNFVKKVVDAHNGRVEVQSNQGSGSLFSIQLPLA